MAERTTNATVFGLPMSALVDGALPVSAISIVKYLDGDGDSCMAFRWSTDLTPPEMIGMLEVMKADLLRDTIRHMNGLS